MSRACFIIGADNSAHWRHSWIGQWHRIAVQHACIENYYLLMMFHRYIDIPVRMRVRVHVRVCVYACVCVCVCVCEREQVCVVRRPERQSAALSYVASFDSRLATCRMWTTLDRWDTQETASSILNKTDLFVRKWSSEFPYNYHKMWIIKIQTYCILITVMW